MKKHKNIFHPLSVSLYHKSIDFLFRILYNYLKKLLSLKGENMPEIQGDNFSTENQVRSVLQTKRLRVAVHIHQFAELVYIIEGETNVRHNKIKETARAGDLVLVLPYQEHGFYTDDNKQIKYWMILFSDTLMSDIVYHENNSFDYKNMVFKPSPELKALIEQKMFDTDNKIVEPDFHKIVNLKAIVYAAFSEYIEKKPSELQLEAASQKQMVAIDPATKTMNYLRANFRREVGIEDCAKEIGYSTSHISHCLKKQFNMTFTQLRNNLRIGYAKILLRRKKMSVYMVALECGFNCELTFEIVFKRLMKMTPRQYRKKYTKNVQKK